MEKQFRNLKMVATEGTNPGYFDIYLEFSGRREFMMEHRWNRELYHLMKAGVTMDEFERKKVRLIRQITLAGRRYGKARVSCRKNHAKKMDQTVGFIIKAVYEHLDYKHHAEYAA